MLSKTADEVQEMKWIIKVLQGQHKGAELALPAGSTFKAGRDASCDLVLLDATLAAEAFELQCGETEIALTARMEGITIGGKPVPKGARASVPLYTEVAVGMTRFCLGEAGKTWEVCAQTAVCGGPRGFRWGRVVCLLGVILFFGGALWGLKRWAVAAEHPQAVSEVAPESHLTVQAIADRFGLAVIRVGERVRLEGNLPDAQTREEVRRLVRRSFPEVILEVTDDETLKRSAEVLLTAFGESGLNVLSATNRCVTLGGTLSSQRALPRLKEAMQADLPYLRQILLSPDVQVADALRPQPAEVPPQSPQLLPKRVRGALQRGAALPIVGIVQTPYPCVMLKDGRKCSEGGSIAGATLLKIDVEEVVLQKEGEVFRWTL